LIKTISKSSQEAADCILQGLYKKEEVLLVLGKAFLQMGKKKMDAVVQEYGHAS
jgi:hypothetical protein